MLNKKNVLLGITGSIAACKSVDLARRLREQGADVRAVMTKSSCRFIPPYALETATGNPVHDDLFSDPFVHITLPKEADLFIVAPATANTINKFSCGIADDLMSTMRLAYEGPLLMAPAMNHRMYRNSIVQNNISGLKKSGVHFVGPATGGLACGEEGTGRMADIHDIIEAAVSVLSPKDLAGQKILVTAGPTIEPIDPVRFISNHSSGKMGYALARAAARRGADVTLISGPVSLKPPQGVNLVPVETASEMEKAVSGHLKGTASVIMAAAVADYSPAETSNVKHKKNDEMFLKFKKNTDIIRKVGRRKAKRVLVGFAAETGRDIASAREKLRSKNLDMIVLNDITQEGAGFNTDTNIVTIIERDGRVTEHPRMEKIEVADIILDRMIEMRRGKQ